MKDASGSDLRGTKVAGVDAFLSVRPCVVTVTSVTCTQFSTVGHRRLGVEGHGVLVTGASGSWGACPSVRRGQASVDRSESPRDRGLERVSYCGELPVADERVGRL